MPATSAMVVIRIGRKRSRLARIIASSRSMPRARTGSYDQSADCVLLNHAEQQQQSQSGKNIYCLAGEHKARMPKGMASGSVSRMVTG